MMKSTNSRFTLFSALALLIAGGAILTPTFLEAAQRSDHAISRLMGYWAGQGKVVPTHGPQRAYRCVVIYRPSKDGDLLQQKLRCRNDDGKLEAITKLKFNGDVVTGEWEETTHNLGGAVSGRVTKEGFDVHLGGRFFQATMRVSTTNCTQTVQLIPVEADQFKELSANLKRRCRDTAQSKN